MSAGRPAGPSSPPMLSGATSKPCSFTVGTSGSDGLRFSANSAGIASPLFAAAVSGATAKSIWPPMVMAIDFGRALERHMVERDLADLRQLRHRQMRNGAEAGAAVVQPALLGFARRHDVGQRLVGAGLHHDHLIVLEGLADRREGLRGVAGLPLGQRLYGDREHRAVHQRVAVGLGAGDLGGAEDAAAAGLVVDDEALAELRGHAVRQHPAKDVRRRRPAWMARSGR